MPKILIIDDDPDIVETTKIILESKGYSVECAESGKQGLEKLKTVQPDLIILDVMMERQSSGFEVSREIKNNPQFKNIPILMLTAVQEKTGFDFSKEAKHEAWLPVDDFVEKPIHPEELLKKAEELIKGS